MLFEIDTSALDGWPDPEAVEQSGVQLIESAQALINMVQSSSSEWSAMGEAYRAPEAPQLLSVFGTVTVKGDGIRSGVLQVSSALMRYAETVRELKRRSASLLTEVAEFQQSVPHGPPGVTGGGHGYGGTGSGQPLAFELAELRRRVAAITAEHQEAQRLCAVAISSLCRNDSVVPTYYAGGTATDFSLQKTLAGLHRLQSSPGDSGQFLSLLGALTPPQLADYGAANRDLFRSELPSPPAAPVAKSWWAGLSAGQQAALVIAAPGVIGNLNGVPYAARTKANKANLDAVFNDPLTSQKSKDALQEIYNALTPPDKHMRTAGRSLVSFEPNDGDKPLAAVAIGDLDTAGNVTWNVPGMGTTVEDGLDSWTKSAQDLYDGQAFALRKHDDLGTRPAVVSWVGYDTPDALPSGEVLSTEEAKAGGEKLAAALDGFRDTRGSTAGAAGSPVPRLHVVAHSYGTTTASYALIKTTHQVDSVTFFGSAGINEREISSAQELNVARDGNGKAQVYVTAANDDQIAPAGISGSGLRGREGRWSPSDSWFGGKNFSSEGGYDPDTGKVYKRTTGHDAKGWAAAGSQDSLLAATGDHGYLDSDTESVHNIALTSTGHGDQIKALIPLKHEEEVGYGGMSYPTGPLIEQDIAVEELSK